MITADVSITRDQRKEIDYWIGLDLFRDISDFTQASILLVNYAGLTPAKPLNIYLENSPIEIQNYNGMSVIQKLIKEYGNFSTVARYCIEGLKTELERKVYCGRGKVPVTFTVNDESISRFQNSGLNVNYSDFVRYALIAHYYLGMNKKMTNRFYRPPRNNPKSVSIPAGIDSFISKEMSCNLSKSLIVFECVNSFLDLVTGRKSAKDVGIVPEQKLSSAYLNQIMEKDKDDYTCEMVPNRVLRASVESKVLNDYAGLNLKFDIRELVRCAFISYYDMGMRCEIVKPSAELAPDIFADIPESIFEKYKLDTNKAFIANAAVKALVQILKRELKSER